MGKVIFTMLFIFFLSINIFAEEPHVYTDQNLENYKPTGKTYVPSREPQHISDIIHEIDIKYDKEYWCRRGKIYYDHIEKAKRRVTEAEDRFNKKRRDNFMAPPNYRDSYGESLAEESLKNTQQYLEDAKDELRELEEEAIRKEIPLGWLRCDFE
jgi:hypothetical protein